MGDNVDDVGPRSTSKILSVSEAYYYDQLEAVDGVYVVGGLLAEGVESPVLSITAEITANPATFASVNLFVDGNLMLPLLPDENGIYEVDLDLQLVENGSHTLQILAVDEA